MAGIDFEKIGRETLLATYRGRIPEIPKGYELLSFREINKEFGTDYFLTSDFCVLPETDGARKLGPRLILRRKTVKKLTGYTVRLLGREPKIGEYYRDLTFGGITVFDGLYPSTHKLEAVSMEPIYIDVPEPTE